MSRATKEQKTRRRRICSQLKIAVAGVLAVSASALFIPRDALAESYCVTTGWFSENWTDIGVGFKVPAKGKCKAFTGFNPGDGFNSPASGVGCTSTDGTNLSLSITVSDPAEGYVEFDDFTLSLPSGSGSGVWQFIASGIVSSSGGLLSGITGASCTVPLISAAKFSGA